MFLDASFINLAVLHAFVTGTIVLTCLGGDKLVTLAWMQTSDPCRVVADSATHCIVALLSWTIVVNIQVQKSTFLAEAVLCGFLASMIDLDHFWLAKSFRLKVCKPNVKFMTVFHLCSL